MTGGADRLLAAWLAWDQRAQQISDRAAARARRGLPYQPPSDHALAREAAEKQAAIAALGLDSRDFHDRVAAMRTAGYSIPDAVQAAVNLLLQEEA